MRKKETDPFDGYGAEIFLDEDHEWLAHLSELPSISAFGATPEEAIAELADAWSAAKETYKARRLRVPVAPSRREYHGVFEVRIDRRVHRALAIEAERAGVSLNALVAQKLANSAQ